jgi:hypothetical protein
MEIFFVFTLLLLALHLGGASAIIKYLSKIRNAAGLLVALVSAYVFSIALDNIWAPVMSGEALTIIPIVAGIAYGLGFYLAARKLATKRIAARCPYMLVGTLALVAGFVGHKHNLAVGASMLLLSVSLPFETQPAPTRVWVTEN